MRTVPFRRGKTKNLTTFFFFFFGRTVFFISPSVRTLYVYTLYSTNNSVQCLGRFPFEHRAPLPLETMRKKKREIIPYLLAAFYLFFYFYFPRNGILRRCFLFVYFSTSATPSRAQCAPHHSVNCDHDYF